MAYKGYHFFIGDLEVPYAPSELKVTIGSNNQTVSLINGNEINILKNPKLTEIEFEIELPRGRQYAFANKLVSSKTYTDYFENLMIKRKPVKLVITRPNPFLKGSTGIGGTIKDFESTVLTVSLEGYDMKESAKNAYDITVSLKFKEYIEYGTIKKVIIIEDNTGDGSGGGDGGDDSGGDKTPTEPVTKPVEDTETYTVKKGDSLWKISRKFYGTGTKWKSIYEANKTVIEDTAKKNGKKSSSNGHWIYPGCKLVIPATKK